MFSDLKKLLNSENHYFETEIKNLRNSCCIECLIKVVDLNETKANFCKKIKINEPPTVNALLFSSSNELHFIQTIDYYQISSSVPVQNLNTELANGDIQNKIEGTLSLLSDMISHYQVSKDFDAFFAQPSPPRKKIKTYLLTGMSDRDYLTIRIGNLDKLNIKTNHPVLGETKIISCEEFNKKYHI